MNPTPAADTSDVLPTGTRLMWYEIQRVLGRGGFAITYLAIDTNLRQRVAVKEYLPMGLAQRAEDGVCARPGRDKLFQWGRERFLAEAQTLARFKHPNIVRVVSFFEANNTAYLVMDFEEGQSLADFLTTHPSPDAAALIAIVQPLMSGLDEMHRAGFIHRDIKPENIYLRRDGSPVLLDFGAARQAVGGQTQNLTSLLSPGYAPLEQYFSEKDRQGPWTDIYALAAVIYRAISGKKPAEASLRSSAVVNGFPDPLKPAQQVGIGLYPAYFLAAIDRGLLLREKERPQSLAEWRTMMEPPTIAPETLVPLNVTALHFDAERTQLPTPPPPATPAQAAAIKTVRPRIERAPKVDEPRRHGWRWLALLAGIVAAGLIYKVAGRAPPAAKPAEPRPEESRPLPRPPPAPARQQLDNSMQACKAEAETYCPGIMPGDGRLAACLRDNRHRFSENCRALVNDRLRGRPPRD